jgi:Flp pilus assembly protein TadG
MTREELSKGYSVQARRFAIPGLGIARAMARDQRASVMVEFAFVAIPFFMLLFGVLETGLIFFGNSMLEKATEDAARLVRTGQAQAQSMTATQFHDYICTQISPVLSCGTSLQVDVESFNGFGSVSISNPIDANGNLNTGLNNYNVGTSGAIVLVRTFYTWDIITPLLRPFFANLSNGRRLMTAASTFRNEPF